MLNIFKKLFKKKETVKTNTISFPKVKLRHPPHKSLMEAKRQAKERLVRRSLY